MNDPFRHLVNAIRMTLPAFPQTRMSERIGENTAQWNFNWIDGKRYTLAILPHDLPVPEDKLPPTRAALERLKARADEDVAEWAGRLAADIAREPEDPE